MVFVLCWFGERWDTTNGQLLLNLPFPLHHNRTAFTSYKTRGWLPWLTDNENLTANVSQIASSNMGTCSHCSCWHECRHGNTGFGDNPSITGRQRHLWWQLGTTTGHVMRLVIMTSEHKIYDVIMVAPHGNKRKINNVIMTTRSYHVTSRHYNYGSYTEMQWCRTRGQTGQPTGSNTRGGDHSNLPTSEITQHICIGDMKFTGSFTFTSACPTLKLNLSFDSLSLRPQ